MAYIFSITHSLRGHKLITLLLRLQIVRSLVFVFVYGLAERLLHYMV